MASSKLKTLQLDFDPLSSHQGSNHHWKTVERDKHWSCSNRKALIVEKGIFALLFPSKQAVKKSTLKCPQYSASMGQGCQSAHTFILLPFYYRRRRCRVKAKKKNNRLKNFTLTFVFPCYSMFENGGFGRKRYFIWGQKSVFAVHFLVSFEWLYLWMRVRGPHPWKWNSAKAVILLIYMFV